MRWCDCCTSCVHNQSQIFNCFLKGPGLKGIYSCYNYVYAQWYRVGERWKFNHCNIVIAIFAWLLFFIPIILRIVSAIIMLLVFWSFCLSLCPAFFAWSRVTEKFKMTISYSNSPRNSFTFHQISYFL